MGCIYTIEFLSGIKIQNYNSWKIDATGVCHVEFAIDLTMCNTLRGKHNLVKQENLEHLHPYGLNMWRTKYISIPYDLLTSLSQENKAANQWIFSVLISGPSHNNLPGQKKRLNHQLSALLKMILVFLFVWKSNALLRTDESLPSLLTYYDW